MDLGRAPARDALEQFGAGRGPRDQLVQLAVVGHIGQERRQRPLDRALAQDAAQIVEHVLEDELGQQVALVAQRLHQPAPVPRRAQKGLEGAGFGQRTARVRDLQPPAADQGLLDQGQEAGAQPVREPVGIGPGQDLLHQSRVRGVREAQAERIEQSSALLPGLGPAQVLQPPLAQFGGLFGAAQGQRQAAPEGEPGLGRERTEVLDPPLEELADQGGDERDDRQAGEIPQAGYAALLFLDHGAQTDAPVQVGHGPDLAPIPLPEGRGRQPRGLAPLIEEDVAQLAAGQDRRFRGRSGDLQQFHEPLHRPEDQDLEVLLGLLRGGKGGLVEARAAPIIDLGGPVLEREAIPSFGQPLSSAPRHLSSCSSRRRFARAFPCPGSSSRVSRQAARAASRSPRW